MNETLILQRSLHPFNRAIFRKASFTIAAVVIGWWIAAGAYSLPLPVLAVATSNNQIHIYGTKGGQRALISSGFSPVTAMIFAPDGHAVFGGSQNQAIQWWSPSDGTLIGSISPSGVINSGISAGPDDVLSMATSPDGQFLATGNHDHDLRLYNIASSHLVWSVPAHSAAVTSVAYSPAGDQIATASADRTIRFWTTKGNLVATIVAQEEPITGIAYLNGGANLISVSLDGTVKVWDCRNGGLVNRTRLNMNGLTCIALSPDSTVAAIGGSNGKVYLVQLPSCFQSRVLNGGLSAVQALGWSSDGNPLVSADQGSMLRYWDAHSGQLVAKLMVGGAITAMAVSPN